MSWSGQYWPAGWYWPPPMPQLLSGVPSGPVARDTGVRERTTQPVSRNRARKPISAATDGGEGAPEVGADRDGESEGEHGLGGGGEVDGEEPDPA